MIEEPTDQTLERRPQFLYQFHVARAVEVLSQLDYPIKRTVFHDRMYVPSLGTAMRLDLAIWLLGQCDSAQECLEQPVVAPVLLPASVRAAHHDASAIKGRRTVVRPFNALAVCAVNIGVLAEHLQRP